MGSVCAARGRAKADAPLTKCGRGRRRYCPCRTATPRHETRYNPSARRRRGKRVPETSPRTTWRVGTVVVLAVILGVAAFFVHSLRPHENINIPYFSIPIGRVRPPMPYRIVSFHRGRADKNLI